MTVDTAAFRRGLALREMSIFASTQRALQRMLALATVRARATRRFKSRSGKLLSAESFVTGARGAFSVYLRNVSPYARWVEDGTSPHPIRARKGKMLRFTTSGGTVVFRKEVRHPGTKSMPFMGDARDAVALSAREILEDAIAQGTR